MLDQKVDLTSVDSSLVIDVVVAMLSEVLCEFEDFFFIFLVVDDRECRLVFDII